VVLFLKLAIETVSRSSCLTRETVFTYFNCLGCGEGGVSFHPLSLTRKQLFLTHVNWNTSNFCFSLQFN
jgi:hypothetical protein